MAQSSSGLVPWLKIYNDLLVAVNQGGKRPGAGCAYLEPWHLDIEEFLDLKKPIYYETSEWGAYGNGFKWDNIEE